MPAEAGIIRYEKVSSTNTVAAELIRNGTVTEGAVVCAQWQESGRGQQGNTWESEPGKNLLMSMILFPAMVPPEMQFDICRVISLGVYHTVRERTANVSIKWPNDIYVSNDKIAGILIENSIMGSRISSSIAGIGLNVNQELFRSNAPNPTSLKIVTGLEYDTEEILSALIHNIGERYNMLKRGMRDRLAADYRDALYRKGEWHHFRDAEGEFTGRIEEASEHGLLIVLKENGLLKEYAFKEIEYIL